ncbi:MAG TPA: tRNA preQ1(34) S-adenosylmethionine ribosyltransferase-isomerase QueA, partial [Bacilli bacterium]|nr:tRNA preQ1(34) S-adenosylmethionine ribosyltransferase-isomerase QueA [Bacilli bacterium]
KKTGYISHIFFKDIANYIEKGDTIVLNDSKVLPGRLLGIKEGTNAKIEILLLKDLGDNVWECLSKPVKRLKVGTIVNFSDKLSCKCINIFSEGIVHIKFIYSGIFMEILDELGEMPLPPYIHKKLKEKDRYQTVYAKNLGSAAAPTAGLHFTTEILNILKEKGINIIYITLHVGLGTFRPVTVDNIKNHVMHSEYYEISSEAAEVLNSTKSSNKKILAIGTTTVRVLETNISNNVFSKQTGFTDIFIYPGYKFKAIDMLLTNFHLPKSTLLMLVSAFASKENILNAYKEAIDNEYRFFSFGDCMLIK